MPAPRMHDLDHFCLFLGASQLLQPREIQHLRAKFAQARPNGSLDHFTQFLHALGKVTAWQSDLLRQEKYKGFFLDCFVLLDRLEYRADHTRFLARNTATQHQLILCVKPHAPNDRDYYWTEELP